MYEIHLQTTIFENCYRYVYIDTNRSMFYEVYDDDDDDDDNDNNNNNNNNNIKKRRKI